MDKQTVRKIENGMLWFNVVSTITWALLVTPTVLWWRDSIWWISLMSVWANFSAALGALIASLAARHARSD